MNSSKPQAAGGLSVGSGYDLAFAAGIVIILTILFLPLPPSLIDVGLSFSITLSVLILMVALWIERPLEFSAFPTVLLIATMLRLALNIATTRLILSHGHQGAHAAGDVVEGFANFVIGGDFVIGTVVFVILVTVNFLVITKGASRIAEVGARFSLDAMPGKQMAIDADLSAGLIDEREATRRRREVEDESAFFGAMDGASKFVRGDAIAGLVITAVNVVGGILIGMMRHDLTLDKAAEQFTKLAIGDGLVTQIPALIVSLAAGLLVSKGGTRGSADEAVLGQLGAQPRALSVAAIVVSGLGLAPGLPLMPFALLGLSLAGLGYIIPKRRETAAMVQEKTAQEDVDRAAAQNAVKESLETAQIELCFGRQVARTMIGVNGELGHRVARMRRKFARQYGFVVPEIRIADEISLQPKGYQIRIHGTVVASGELRPGDILVVYGEGRKPDLPGDETREPAFGMRAVWLPEMFSSALKQEGFVPVDAMSVLLTHLAEVVRNNLAQLLSYKDLRMLIDRLEPEYRKLVDEICPAHLSYSGLQAVLKLLLAERVSIRNLHLILEAIAEVAPFVRKTEVLAEHVRQRIAQQICGDFATENSLKVVRLGSRWELAFQQAIRRDAKGEIVEFNIDPRLIEQFGNDAARLVPQLTNEGHAFVIVTAADTRPYVRMLVERMYPNLAVLSHAEITRTIQVVPLGALS